MRPVVSIFVLCFLLASNASAHSGGTDIYGCHHCYTAECYGDYHCHNPKYFIQETPSFIFPKPTSPASAEISQKVSSENWCNYDVSISWLQPTYGDRYSLAISKVPGGDPGPLVDTSELDFTFKNVSPGKWYINFKSGNSERWGDISYWEINLPKLKPNLEAEIEKIGNSHFLNYTFTCLESIVHPQQIVDHLATTGNKPSGAILLTDTFPSSIDVQGFDKNGMVYKKSLFFTKEPNKVPEIQRSEQKSQNFELIVLASSVLLILTMVWFLQRRKSTKVF